MGGEEGTEGIMLTSPSTHLIITNTHIRMFAGISLGTFTLPDVLERCVLFSMSQAWQLGRAVLGARVTHSSILDTIVSQQHGTLIIAGKVGPSHWSLCTYVRQST